jgi:integrase/recombinase XerD
LKKLFDYRPEEGGTEQFYVDIWLFSYLSNGINMKDLFRLKYSCIMGDSIEFERAKTANSSSEPKKLVSSILKG